MLNIKQIRSAIRAKFYLPKITIREQGRLADASHQSMMRLNKRCDALTMEYPSIESMTDSELVKTLYPASVKPVKNKRQPDIEEILVELTKPRGKRKSRTVLYLEYVAENPETALNRTHFFRIVRQALKRCKLTMKQLHMAGEITYIDYAGTKIFYLSNGKKVWVKVFVAVLGASQKMFAWATYGEKTQHWIEGMTRMFEDFGGPSEVVGLDNAKALVTKPGLMAVLNQNIEAFAEHYGVLIDTCRANHPQDKALVEMIVKFITQRILIPMMQNHRFFSLDEINEHLCKEVEKLNNLPFQGTQISRNDLFVRNEKAVLKPLPAVPFKMLVALEKTRVLPDYHVKYKDNFYSVPFQLRGEQVEIRVDQNSLKVIHDNNQVAEHKVLNGIKLASTQESHMPAEHLADKHNNSQTRNLAWAKVVGESIHTLVTDWYGNTVNPSSRAIGTRCLKLKSFVKKHGEEIVDKACQYALCHNMKTPEYVAMIISAQAHEDGFENLPVFNPAHQNVRGKEYYGGHHEA